LPTNHQRTRARREEEKQRAGRGREAAPNSNAYVCLVHMSTSCVSTSLSIPPFLSLSLSLCREVDKFIGEKKRRQSISWVAEKVSKSFSRLTGTFVFVLKIKCSV